MLAHQPDILGLEDAAFGDHALAGRNHRQQVQRRLQRGLEGAQVAVVDADERGAQRQRGVQFLGVVYFHQHVHAQVDGQGFQVAQLRRRQRRDDEQDAVRAHGARRNDLVGIDDEVLAQHGQRAGRARTAQVVVRALEELHVGQHRQAGRAMHGIGRRDLGRVEVFAQHALGRRGFLDFRDDARLALADLVLDGLGEAAYILARLGFAQQFGLAAHLPCGSHFLGLDGEDFRKNIVHFWNFRVYAQNSSSLARAEPLEIVSNARANASGMESALLPA
ncbi:Uncharacterised protein [Bordetella pertussis]|nr:Uncharacterised protein [Bordetella pertussis]